MKANEVQMHLILSAMAHYIVPLFQRPYSWKLKHWIALWSDILETYDQNPPGTSNVVPHFLGAVVSKSAGSTMGGVSSFLLIDGQQRLTTVLILLAALRDAARPVNAQLATKVHEVYLTNRFSAAPHDQKLLPSQLDRPGYSAVMNGGHLPGESSNVIQAYRYFANEIARTQLNDPLDLEHLERVIVSGLEVVSITLEGTENEYRIFESLNGRGEPLTQADLLRNYFFMRIPLVQQEQIYQAHWLPMQHALGETGVADYFRHLINSDGTFVPERDVYVEWKKLLDTFDTDKLMTSLREITHGATLYQRIISPESEPNPDVAKGMRCLNRWGASTIYPFLLALYEERDSGRADDSQVAQVLRLLESYLVRRLLAGVPNNSLSRIFLRLSGQIPEGMNVVEGTRAALSDPGRRWPRDRDLIDAVKRVPFYLNGRSEQRKFVLEELERQLNPNEPVDPLTLTIEHIMPQTLTPEWRSMLGSEADEVHQTLLHTLGNITLTGYNTPLSNNPFDQKRHIFADSNIALNREVAKAEIWGTEQILARADRLAAVAIEHWPGPVATATPQPPDLADERELIQHVLTRMPIPAGQVALFRVLYDAGEGGASTAQICERIGRTRNELRATLGALGRRVNDSIEDQIEAKPGMSLFLGWKRADSHWQYWLRPEFRAALETNGML